MGSSSSRRRRAMESSPGLAPEAAMGKGGQKSPQQTILADPPPPAKDNLARKAHSRPGTQTTAGLSNVMRPPAPTCAVLSTPREEGWVGAACRFAKRQAAAAQASPTRGEGGRHRGEFDNGAVRTHVTGGEGCPART